jgi:hypothetical protein
MKLLLAIACLTVAAAASAQTPFATENVGRSTPKQGSSATPSTQGVSAANPWLGAQVAYRFGGTKELADNLFVAAHFINEIPTSWDRIHLPVMGNFSELSIDSSKSETPAQQVSQGVQQLVSSASGIRLGLYPYVVAAKGDNVTVVFHGEAAWKLNSVKGADDSPTYLNAFRVSGGIEIGVGQRKDGKMPATLSVAPVITMLSAADYQKVSGQSKSAVKSFEATLILPWREKMGFLFEGIVGQSDARGFRAAIVIATDSK